MGIIKIMPCLDMKEGRVVKGINFVDLKDAGDPVENAKFYQQEGADELAMLDIAATLENRSPTSEAAPAIQETGAVSRDSGPSSLLLLASSIPNTNRARRIRTAGASRQQG